MLSMSVLAGALTLSKHCITHGIQAEDAAPLMAKGMPGYGQYDYLLAAELIHRINWLAEDDPAEEWHGRLFRLVDTVVITDRPSWITLTPYGRSFAVEQMDQAAIQCLRDTGLLQNSPQARKWWDKLAHLARQELDEERLQVGREGELLSIEKERLELVQSGRGDLAPTWSSLDDNSLGYDIASWRVDPTGFVEPKTIEVKAGRSNPVLIHISRGQWRFALAAPSHEFHVWDLSGPSIRVLPGQEITMHAPLDQAEGQWSEFTLAVDVRSTEDSGVARARRYATQAHRP